MSKSAHLSSPPPSAPPSEPSLYDDRSAVRPRIRPASFAASVNEDFDIDIEVDTETDPEPESSERPDSDWPTLPSGSNEWVELNERLERKLRFAKVVLQLLPANDARVRLLRAAIAQKDEALLEGLLNSLDDGTAREATDRRTLLPPAKPKKQ